MLVGWLALAVAAGASSKSMSEIVDMTLDPRTPRGRIP